MEHRTGIKGRNTESHGNIWQSQQDKGEMIKNSNAHVGQENHSINLLVMKGVVAKAL